MISPRKLLLVIIFALAALGVSAANDVYLAQSAQGANNGTDCGDARPYTFFNTQANWGGGGGQIGPGTTVHVCGTVTGNGSNGTNIFTFQGSGSSAGNITLHFENNAILQEAYFGAGSSAAIVMNGKSYITIDGGTNGLIQDTANGTAGSGSCPKGSCTFQQASSFIQADCSTNCEIKNLTLGPDYVRSASGDSAPCNFSNEGAIFISGASASTNFLIHDNTIHDGRWINTFEFGNGSNFQFYNNTVYASGHAIAVEIGSNSKFNGMYIYGNHIYDFTEWSGNGCFHNNAIHVFQSGGNNTGSIIGLYIYNNEFDGSMAGNSTDQIYLEPNGSVNSVGTGYIFNNILTLAGDETGGDGVLGAFAGGTSLLVANNTIICNASNQNSPNESGAGADQPIGTTTWTNNIATGCSTMWRGDVHASGGPNFASGQPDYNLWSVGESASGWQCNGNFLNSISTWRSCIGNETHSAYFATSPLPPCNSIHDCSNVRPQSGSTAIAFAQNLSSTCNSGSIPGIGALCHDKPQKIGPGSGTAIGNARPGNGLWEAGAYQSGGGNPAPAPPGGLAAVVQ